MGFIDVDAREPKELLPGVDLRTFWGDRMLLSHVTLKPGAEVPRHSHPHEQAGVVLSGSMEMTIGNETRTVGPGEMYIASGDEEHRVVAGPDGCVALGYL